LLIAPFNKQHANVEREGCHNEQSEDAARKKH
jgi:hypothetical protein